MNLRDRFTALPAWAQLMLLPVFMFFFMMVFTVPSLLIYYADNGYWGLYAVQALSSIGLFLLPALMTAYLYSHKPVRETLRLNKAPKLWQVLLVVLTFIAYTPLIEWTVLWNESWQLPEAWQGIEEMFRAMEDEASGVVKQLVQRKGVGYLIANLVLIALLPAVCEELIFRGIVQGLCTRWTRSNHWAIVITAVIFSAVHFQFYGFIPRLLLGLALGYVYLWTRNLWVPMLLHFINNGVAVVGEILTYKGVIDEAEMFTQSPYVWIGIGLTGLLVYVFIRWYKQRPSDALMRLEE